MSDEERQTQQESVLQEHRARYRFFFWNLTFFGFLLGITDGLTSFDIFSLESLKSGLLYALIGSAIGALGYLISKKVWNF